MAVVACGDRLRETLIMLKSALMFTKEKLNFIVLAEDGLIESFNQKVGISVCCVVGNLKVIIVIINNYLI